MEYRRRLPRRARAVVHPEKRRAEDCYCSRPDENSSIDIDSMDTSSRHLAPKKVDPTRTFTLRGDAE